MSNYSPEDSSNQKVERWFVLRQTIHLPGQKQLEVSLWIKVNTKTKVAVCEAKQAVINSNNSDAVDRIFVSSFDSEESTTVNDTRGQ